MGIFGDRDDPSRSKSSPSHPLLFLFSPLNLQDDDGRCTRQGLQLEQWAVKYVDDTKNACPALNSRFVPAAHLSQEQKEAVTSILTTRDRVFSFRGVAGSGKTTTLREVQRGLSEAGHTVFAITPTASAARVLRNEGFSMSPARGRSKSVRVIRYSSTQMTSGLVSLMDRY